MSLPASPSSRPRHAVKFSNLAISVSRSASLAQSDAAADAHATAALRHARGAFVGLERPFTFDDEEPLRRKARAIKHRLRSSMLYWSIKRTVKAELIKSKYRENEVAGLITKILERRNLKVKLRNEICRLHERASAGARGFSRMDRERGRRAPTKKRKTRPKRTAALATAAAAVVAAGAAGDDLRPRTLRDVAAAGGTLVVVGEGGAPGVLTLPSFALDPYEDKIDIVNHARISWIEFIKERITSISRRLNIPLAVCLNIRDRDDKKKRSKKKKGRGGSDPMLDMDASSGPTTGSAVPPGRHLHGDNELNSSFSDLPPNYTNHLTSHSASTGSGRDGAEMPKYTGVFGPSNLFEVCIKIRNPNHERTFAANAVGWGLIKLRLRTRGIKELRRCFEELDPTYRRCGIDDERREWYNRDVLSLGKRVTRSSFLPVVCKFCRRGCPLSLRPSMWKRILNVRSTPRDRRYYESLVRASRRTRYLIDDMVANDVKRTCDDENYFVFEDELREAMRAFSRDPWIRNNSALKSLSLFGIDGRGRTNGASYPPSGVIPFEGLSLLAAPLAYLYSNVEDIYYTFRGLYCKHLCKLHTVSSEPDSIMHLCKLFEDLLRERDPRLFYHLLRLNIHPLSIAFHWIFHGFAGYLNVHELLLLWDRILGFGNLYLLSVLAASLFWLRSRFLMRATNPQEVYDVFSDFTVIKCIPLLRMFLFG